MPLERVNTTKFLGIIIDENLTWKSHIDAISKTISRNIGMLSKMKHYVPGYILYSLYCTLVLPYTNYGILIWGNTCKTYLDNFFKLQKWAIRIISLEHYRSHTGPLFKKNNVLNIFDTFKLELGVFMYKHQTNLLPQTFSNYVIKHNQIHKYPTRNAEDYGIKKAKKTKNKTKQNKTKQNKTKQNKTKQNKTKQNKTKQKQKQKQKNKTEKQNSDRSIRITGPTLWNSLDTKMKHCKLLNTSEMCNSQI